MKLSITKLAGGLFLLLGMLYGMTGVGAAQTGAEVGVFEPIEVPPGAALQVPVSIRNVEALYAIDIEIQFDPALLQVEDAAPNTPGVQVGIGTFLDAGLILYNDADNDQGVIRFAMTQVNPSEPKSGEGVIVVINLTAQGEGESALTVSFAEASTRQGEAIPITGVNGVVTVSSGAPDQPATDIPVQDPQLATLIPTLAPTLEPTMTATPQPTPTPKAVVEEAGETPDTPAESPGEEGAPAIEDEGMTVGEDPEEEVEDIEAAEESEETGAGILDYWWVVLLVVLAAGGTGAYLLLSKKRA